MMNEESKIDYTKARKEYEEMMKEDPENDSYTDERKTFIDIMEQVESEENIDEINESNRKSFEEMMKEESKIDFAEDRKEIEEMMKEEPKQDYSEDRKMFEDIITGNYKPESPDTTSDTVRTNENLPYGGKPQQQNKQESRNEMTMGM